MELSSYGTAVPNQQGFNSADFFTIGCNRWYKLKSRLTAIGGKLITVGQITLTLIAICDKLH